MKFKVTIAALVAALAGALFVWGAGSVSAQTVTSDPIQTVPGYPGCGGNSTYQYLGQGQTITCANQRTFHLGAIARTVVAVSKMNADGTASTTFTVTGGNAIVDFQLRVTSHVGNSDGTVVDNQTGVIPKGTAGPVTLTYAYDCGQVDVKAILVANGDTNGRISGGAFCKFVVPAETTTTTPGSTTPSTTAPQSSTVPTSVPNTSGGPGVSASARVEALPATGAENGDGLFYGLLVLSVGIVLVGIGYHRKGLRH